MSLYTWSVDHLLQPDDPIVNLRQHVLQFSPDPIQPNHPGQNLKLTSRTQEEFPNCDTFPAMKNTVETDLGLLHPERNRCPYSKKPQLECRVCGKMFRSTSSLTKHVASHSQERKHVCDICKKAFKRQDHLNGHMLTHQNSKPYVCTELGCNKSYCDSRSLKRHLIVNHGQVTGKNISALNSTCNESRKKEQPMPFLLLPLGTKVQKVPLQASLSIMDLIRYQINSQEKMVSNVVIQDSSRSPRVEAEHTHLDSIPSNTYTLVNDTSEVSEGPRILLYPDQDPSSEPSGFWTEEALNSISSEQNMFSYSMDGSSQCLVQDTANSQPVEYNLNQPVEKYMSSASTSLDTPLSDQNQKPLDTLSSVQQSFSKVTHPTYESYKLQSQQTFNSLVNFPSLLSQEQSQKHPKMATYFGRDDEQKHDFMKADAPTSYSCPCSVIYSNIGNQKSQVFADCLSSNALKCSSQLTSSKSKDEQNFEINHQQSPSKEHAFCVDNVVSPSQVAVEYFPFSANLPEKKTSDFASFNMFESENTHDLPCEKSNSTDFTDRLSAALRMMELSDSHVALPSSSVVENNLMYTDKGALSRPLQDLQEEDPEDCRRNIFLQGPKRPMGIMKDPMPFVMPVSVPVIVTDHKVNVEEGPLQNQNTKKRKRPCPKSLYIPPPVLDLKLSTTGYFQSKIRSPNTYLQNGIFRYQAYTPPPMLSPIRSGSGLYFNTFCSPSSATGPTFSLPVKETSPCGIMLTKDSMVFTVQPHINIGKRFQAEIPEIQGALCLENDKADLVWKPLKVTKSVSKFLNLACSSAIPGGGNNLEFALHCLHLSQGNLMAILHKS